MTTKQKEIAVMATSAIGSTGGAAICWARGDVPAFFIWVILAVGFVLQLIVEAVKP